MNQSQLKDGSVLGGVLLLAGSCIGAGMLALPVITGPGGFLPSITMLLFSWFFMLSTGLLLLEANLKVGHSLSLISIAEKTLGVTGKVLCWLLFLFLFYSLSIAYISASGSILESILMDLFGILLPGWLGSTLFTLSFAIVLYAGTREVDYLNRLLMIGLVAAYCILVLLGVRYIQITYLSSIHWIYSFAALPVLIISFGFHNMIPSLAMYFKGDIKRLRLTIILGSMIPLLIYMLWEVVMLGVLPIKGPGGLLQALRQGEVATTALRAVAGSSWITTVGQSFALFAIITSFLAQSLSLVDFLGDGLKIPKVNAGRLALVFLTLAPPFLFAFIYPGIFIRALNFAGGFSAVILFGAMPVLMVWKLRYRSYLQEFQMLPLGKFLLILVLVISIGIFGLELFQELGFSLIPQQSELIP